MFLTLRDTNYEMGNFSMYFVVGLSGTQLRCDSTWVIFERLTKLVHKLLVKPFVLFLCSRVFSY